MSLKPSPIEPVPEETRRVAQAAFPKGNVYLTIRDKLGTIFQDDDFADLYPNGFDECLYVSLRHSPAWDHAASPRLDKEIRVLANRASLHDGRHRVRGTQVDTDHRRGHTCGRH